MATSVPLTFNGRYNITSISYTSGTWPTRRYTISGSFYDNLTEFILTNVLAGDLFYDVNRKEYEVISLTGFNLLVEERPYNPGPFPGPIPFSGQGVLFRPSPNCNLKLWTRTEAGISESLKEYLTHRMVLEVDAELCGATASSDYAINILGSTATSAPFQGQTTGILDRPIPVDGDEWINPETGDRWIYQNGMWQLAPCCSTNGAINIIGSTATSSPFEGQTGGIPDRTSPIQGDEWINPLTGDRWIYQDGMWQLAPCCSSGAINILGSTSAAAPFQGQTGGIIDRLNPVEGDEWIDPSTGERWIYQDGIWQLSPSGITCSPLFNVETGTGATGQATSGPFPIDCGDTLRIWSEGNLYVNATQGSAQVQIEPNNIFSEPGNPNTTRLAGPPDPTRSATYLDVNTGVPYIWDTYNLIWVSNGQIVRYAATGTFHDPANNHSAIIRSTIRNGVSVTRSGSTSAILAGIGYTYTVDVPIGDDIFYLHLFDGESISGSSQLGIRIVVNWAETSFVGNVTSVTPTPVGPNIQVMNHGNYDTGPNLTNAVRVRTPGIGSNDAAITTFDSRSVTIDIQTADTADVFYSVILAF